MDLTTKSEISTDPFQGFSSTNTESEKQLSDIVTEQPLETTKESSTFSELSSLLDALRDASDMPSWLNAYISFGNYSIKLSTGSWLNKTTDYLGITSFEKRVKSILTKDTEKLILLKKEMEVKVSEEPRYTHIISHFEDCISENKFYESSVHEFLEGLQIAKYASTRISLQSVVEKSLDTACYLGLSTPKRTEERKQKLREYLFSETLQKYTQLKDKEKGYSNYLSLIKSNINEYKSEKKVWERLSKEVGNVLTHTSGKLKLCYRVLTQAGYNTHSNNSLLANNHTYLFIP